MDTKPNEKTQGAPRTWGVSASEFYAALRDKPAQIVTLDAKVYSGVLVGLDQYDLIVRQSSGAVVLLCKGAIKTVTGAAVNGGQTN